MRRVWSKVNKYCEWDQLPSRRQFNRAREQHVYLSYSRIYSVQTNCLECNSSVWTKTVVRFTIHTFQYVLRSICRCSNDMNVCWCIRTRNQTHGAHTAHTCRVREHNGLYLFVFCFICAIPSVHRREMYDAMLCVQLYICRFRLFLLLLSRMYIYVKGKNDMRSYVFIRISSIFLVVSNIKVVR